MSNVGSKTVRAEGDPEVRKVRPRARLVIGASVITLGLVLTGVAAASSAASSDAPMSAMAGMPLSSTYWGDVGGAPFANNGVTRTYYIAADQVDWNYAPDGTNDITGQPFDEVADTYVEDRPRAYRIAVREVPLPRVHRRELQASQPPRPDKYLGLLGPVIRAEVGDTIHVIFRNNCPFPTSVHPHGVFYAKNSEGAPYNDGTSGADKADDAVPTGGEHTYVWQVPERAGPGPSDGSSVMWMYHSHTDEVADTYAGLMGPIEITRRGMARPDGSPKDVDREVFELYSGDEREQEPVASRRTWSGSQSSAVLPDDLDDEDFDESNLMHSINGYVFGNQPVVTMKRASTSAGT